MSDSQRKTLLSLWTRPSSDHEKETQQRAESMVDGAIKSRDAFKDSHVRIFPKGSYYDNTNVRLDSDVDIVVELQDCIYWDYSSGVTPGNPAPSIYSGPWTKESWRAAVVAALKSKFGADQVDTSGHIAINIKAVEGSRPSIDVVPSFKYHRHDDSARSAAKTHTGSCVWSTDGRMTVNRPQQQHDNGVEKNKATGGRYKDFVRILKNAENALVKSGQIKALPSYLMECLVFNVKNDVLTTGDLPEGFKPP